MCDILQHPDGQVRLEPLADGRRRIMVCARHPGVYIHSEGWVTRYPTPLLTQLLELKGPGWLCDEVRRDEDPTYVENDLRHDVLGFVAPADLQGRRILDFGCGCGSSLVVLSRLAPGCRITGIDLVDGHLQAARLRAEFNGLQDVRLICSPSSDDLPPDLGTFDYVMFSAVFEHLLPDERPALLLKVWEHLAPGGVLFLNQTPHRWFPVEGHTTNLPLLNYLPDRLALTVARRFSRRRHQDADWPGLLRNGIRGGTEGEVLSLLRSAGQRVESLPPTQHGLRDHLDLWAASSSLRHTGVAHRGKVATLRLVKMLSGQTLVPNISLALRKLP